MVWRGQAQAAYLHALSAGERGRRHERLAVAQGDRKGRVDRGVTLLMNRRRHFLGGLAAALAPVAVRSDDFPARPITLVVPFPAGGAMSWRASSPGTPERCW